jgi:hypothetical protein
LQDRQGPERPWPFGAETRRRHAGLLCAHVPSCADTTSSPTSATTSMPLSATAVHHLCHLDPDASERIKRAEVACPPPRLACRVSWLWQVGSFWANRVGWHACPSARLLAVHPCHFGASADLVPARWSAQGELAPCTSTVRRQRPLHTAH